MAPRFSQKTIFNMASVRHLEFEKLQILLKIHVGNWDVHLPTKFDRNRIILGWDMEIMLFSKWRPSSILNLRKLQFCSRDLYRHVIFHLRSKFRFDRPIWRRDMAKKLFSIWRPSAILNLQNFNFFVKCQSWELKSTSVYQIWSKSDNSRLRYESKSIFKMAAVRHLEFSKITVLVTWLISACDPSSPFQISRWSANMAPRYSQIRIWRPSAILDLLWRHRIASKNCISRYTFQHFGLKLPISGLILTIFGEK